MPRILLRVRRSRNNASLRLRHTERLLFAKRLALYLRAGVPLLEALGLLLPDTSTGAYRHLLERVYDSVCKGQPLSQALARHPRAFAPMHIQLVAIGEATGSLPETLGHLSSMLSRGMRLRRDIATALAYPAILLFATFAVSGFLIVYAFPKVLPLFRGLHATLPLTTRILLAISSNWAWCVVGIAAVCATGCLCAILAHRHEWLRLRVHTLLLCAPVIGSAVRSYNLALLFKMLSVMQQSGARIDATIALARSGWRNRVYRDSLASLEQTVLAGGKLATGLRQSPSAYTAVAIQLIEAGERTGGLAQSAHAVAEIYEEQLSDSLARLSAALEPLLLLFMGAVVGFVALAIISPLYALTQALSIH